MWALSALPSNPFPSLGVNHQYLETLSARDLHWLPVWDLGDIYTIFHYGLNCLILISVNNLLVSTTTHFNTIHWRLQLLVQTKDTHSLFIPISPDYSCLTTIYFQEPFLPPYFQLPVDSEGQKGLGRCSTNYKKQQMKAQTSMPPKLSITIDKERKTFYNKIKFKHYLALWKGNLNLVNIPKKTQKYITQD